MENNLRFRVWLPVLLVLAAIILDKTGDMQLLRLVHQNVAKYGRMEHPLPNDYAIARYMDYGVNAPAWVLSSRAPFLPGTANFSWFGVIRTDMDWEYLILVAVMWYLIGGRLDKWGSAQYSDTSSDRTLLSIINRIVLALYGIFLCYS